MTEKERILAEVMEHFMNKADEWRKVDLVKGDFESVQKFVSAGQWDAAAVEVAGLGASQGTIDKVVERYLKQIKHPLFHHDFMHKAVHMAKVGASPKVIEEILRFMLKHYCHSWTINYLEELTALVSRKPTREEIFVLAQLERKNEATWDETLHRELVALANKYLLGQDVERVKGMIKEKIREWESHADI
ncbi:MAG: hypothetical protein HY505_00090 [Candidatus Yanofskybacteria bacterium]|nr:hypothetical protein [Candidatus Yanofskybacteria bacterium]